MITNKSEIGTLCRYEQVGPRGQFEWEGKDWVDYPITAIDGDAYTAVGHDGQPFTERKGPDVRVILNDGQ